MNTNTKWLSSIVVGAPRETVVEAAYYAVRELKQGSVPAKSRKEHFVDASESEPSQEARELAARIILAVQAREKTTIDDLSRETLFAYVNQLLSVVREVSAEAVRLDPAQGRALLERLRAK